MNSRSGALRRCVASVLVAVTVALTSGCATMAHRSSISGRNMRTTSNCDGQGDSCPWLGGDALLLLAGIVPGVVAFAVDFSTGAWRHDRYEGYEGYDDEVADAGGR